MHLHTQYGLGRARTHTHTHNARGNNVETIRWIWCTSTFWVLPLTNPPRHARVRPTHTQFLNARAHAHPDNETVPQNTAPDSRSELQQWLEFWGRTYALHLPFLGYQRLGRGAPLQDIERGVPVAIVWWSMFVFAVEISKESKKYRM